MTLTTPGSGESRLETIISYLLIVGVAASLVLEVIGIVMFYRSYGSLSILLKDEAMFIHGRDFFSFLRELFSGRYASGNAVLFMALGIAILALTPYVRVIASALYFALRKDARYVVITVFVLAVLTVSLALH